MIGKNRKKGCVPCRTEPDLKKKKGPRNGFVSHCTLTYQVKASLRQREGGSRVRPGMLYSYSYLHTQETSGVGKYTQPTNGKTAVIS